MYKILSLSNPSCKKSILPLIFILNIIILNSVSVYAQQSRLIQGIVSSAENQTSLEGVSVMKSGSSIGVITNSDGKYAINLSNGDTLIFSYLGYFSQKIAVKGRSMINVALVKLGATNIGSGCGGGVWYPDKI